MNDTSPGKFSLPGLILFGQDQKVFRVLNFVLALAAEVLHGMYGIAEPGLIFFFINMQVICDFLI
jgi:hypothetical protein